MPNENHVPFVSVNNAYSYLVAEFWAMASTRERCTLTPAQNEALAILRAAMRAQILTF